MRDLDAVFAGDIVAGIGMKNTRTGDTLCDPSSPLVLEELVFPDHEEVFGELDIGAIDQRGDLEAGVAVIGERMAAAHIAEPGDDDAEGCGRI